MVGFKGGKIQKIVANINNLALNSIFEKQVFRI
jgi:hypothetical protein